MARYFLTQRAKEDLSEIWEYTFGIWSESQADTYYFSLLADCQMLAENPFLGKNYPEIGKNIFGFKSGEHLIFYRKSSEHEIEVIRFLHSRMDLKNRLSR